MRPSFLTSFLANLGPAMQGATQIIGPHLERGGLSGALGEIRNQQLQNRQFGLQQQEEARQNALAQSTLASQESARAYQTAETNRLNALTPFDVQDRKLQTDLMMANIKFYASPDNLTGAVQDATKSLGQLSAPEQAQIDAATKEAQITRKFDPINTAVRNISQDRITTARGTDTSAFKAWRSQFIKEHGREPNSQEIQGFTTAGQMMRIAGLENLRQDNYLDTSVPGGSVATMTAGEFAVANKLNPGRFVKYNGTVSNTLKAQSFISDIRDGMRQMLTAVNAPNFKLSSKARALMSLANRNPETAVSTVMSGLAAQNLSGPEQDYLIAHASLLERAMSLRSLQGQGAGSDQQRAAIAGLVPGFATANKDMALKLLTTLSNNVDNVEKAFPKVGGSSTQPSASSKRFIRPVPNVVVEQ